MNGSDVAAAPLSPNCLVSSSLGGEHLRIEQGVHMSEGDAQDPGEPVAGTFTATGSVKEAA